MIQKKTPRNKALLVRRLVKLEYKDGHSMMEHLNSFKGLVNQLNKVDLKVEDEMQALLLLSSLPESWDTLVVTLSNSAPEGKLTMDTVSDSLLNEETRRKERGLDTLMEANIVDRRGRDDTRGHNKFRGRDHSRGRFNSRTRVICNYCDRLGHKMLDCRFFKKDQQDGNDKQEEFNPTRRLDDKTATIVEGRDEDVYLIEECNLPKIASSDTSWIVDSGASVHITPHRSFFTNYHNGDFGNVQMGNRGRSKIIGKGDVILTSNTGCKMVLKEVRHVPDIQCNLISTGKLDDAGLESHFGNDKWKLTKGILVMARGSKEGSLYVTLAKLCKEKVNVGSGDMKIWHRRRGHMREKTPNILCRKKLHHDMRGTNLKTYSKCLNVKQEQDASKGSSISTGRHFSRVKIPSTRDNSNELVGIKNRESQSYKEAIVDTHKDGCVKAMQDEMQSLHENHMYVLVKLPIKNVEDYCQGSNIKETLGYFGKGEIVGFIPSLAQDLKPKLGPKEVKNSLEGASQRWSLLGGQGNEKF